MNRDEAEAWAGSVWEELQEAEKLAMDNGMEEINSFTQACGGNYTIICC